MPHFDARFARPATEYGSDGKQGRETKQRQKASASLGAQRDGLERPGRRKAADVAFVVLSGAGRNRRAQSGDAGAARASARVEAPRVRRPGSFARARRQWPEFWKAMIVGEDAFFRRFRRLNNRRSGGRLAIAAVARRGRGACGPLFFSDCGPAPSAKRNRRPMRGAFRSSRFVLRFACVARAVAPAARKGAQSAAMRPIGLGRGLGRRAAWRRNSPNAPRALFDAARQGLDPPDSQESAGCADSGAANGRPIGAGPLLSVARGAVAVSNPFPIPVLSASALATAARRSRPQRAVVFVGGGGGELQKLGAHVAQLGVEDAADLLVAPAQIILDVEALVAFQRKLDQNARLAF